MKKIIVSLIVIFLFSQDSPAQILKKLGERAKQKAEQKADEKVDKTIDEAVDGKKGTAKENNSGSDNATNNESKGSEANGDNAKATETEALKSYSKYDFIQGEKVINYEDFSRTDVGDFPTLWNTDGSAEIVTINKKEGKWLRVNGKGHFLPEFIKNIPDNSTLEFDLGVNTGFSWGSGYLQLVITHKEDRDALNIGSTNHALVFDFHPLTGENYTGGVGFTTRYGKNNISNNGNAKKWDAKNNLFAHISLWRQGQRMRMYVNGDKIYDVPKAFEAGAKYTTMIFSVDYLQAGKDDFYLLGNIRLAEGAPDTRNKLITEGKFTTSGITFNTNSDQLKPESYGVLKDIARVLTENADLKINIIGHTDSDGDDNSNLELSKRRATAVKNALANEFSIDASRMKTDGKGESVPLADNKIPEGKAQNRRVEFVRM